MKIALSIIGGLLCLLLLGFGLQYWDLVNFGFFAPKYAKVQRKVFENTPSYVQGKIQDLSNYKLQYDTTKDQSSKQMIQGVIRSQFANFNTSDCPVELQTFLQQMRGY